MESKNGVDTEKNRKNQKCVSDKKNSKSSRKSRPKKNKITCRTEIGVIRKKIYQHYEKENEAPTIGTLVEILGHDGFVYDWEYLKELINEMGFRYIRCKSPSRRHFLTEKSDLGCRRAKYLEQIRECRAQNRNVYFMHETFMEARDVARKAEQYLRADIPTKIDEKDRLVIVHFGGPSGLINGTFTTIKSDSATGDHFGEVNQPKFDKWVNDNLKDKLPPNSMIAISSAPYHSVQKDKMPRDMFTSKSDMKGWLRRHNVEFEENLERVFLLDVIKKTRIKPVYVFDEVLKGLGHTVLRVPPQHPELNPLEFVWADIKKNIAQNHANASINEKKKIWGKLYSEYPTTDWQKWDDQVKNTENEYYDYEYKLDDIIDDIIGRYEKDTDSDSETCESDPDQSDSMSE